jgi:hypothetical protein
VSVLSCIRQQRSFDRPLFGLQQPSSSSLKA